MKYPKLLRDGNSFVYLNNKGELSEKYYWAGEYRYGFAVVEKIEDRLRYFRDAKGNLSESFWSAGDYNDGFAVVQKEQYGPYYYRDVEGNLSEGFCFARDYHEGFAVVLKEKGGPYYYRDANGNISEECFWKAGHYCKGFAVVQKKKDGPVYFRDAKGNLSEGFEWVSDYQKDGFAQVSKEGFSRYLFRDIGGNLWSSSEEAVSSSQKIQAEQSKAQESAKKLASAKGDNDIQKSTPVEVKSGGTEKGLLKRQIKQRNGQKKTKSTPAKGDNYAKIEDYFKNKVSVYSLSPEDIYTYLNKIVAWEKYNIKLEMENADRDAGAEILKEARITADYIKQTAYEYSEELKNRKPSAIEEDIYQLF